jgi:hypothetical protein
MRVATIACGCAALCSIGSGQDTLCPPQIAWQQTYGSVHYDGLTIARPCATGGYFLAGNRIGFDRGAEFYIIRLDAAANVLWDATFGGAAYDVLTAAVETSDGGFLLAGWSASFPIFTKTAPSYGVLDYWIVRLDAAGNKMWDRSFGGTGSDELHSVLALADGGFLLGGYSSSPQATGTKSSHHYGHSDYWVVRVNADGHEVWQQSYGGSENDYLLAMAASTNGYLLAGGSFSNTNAVKTSPILGGHDIWAVRIDDNGLKLWDNTYGGQFSEFGRDILSMPDGGYLLGSSSASGISGNKTAPNFGGEDFWVVRIDGSGNKLWDRAYGGSNQDTLTALASTADGGLLATGYSASGPGGTKESRGFGGADFWLVRLGANGQQLWDQSFGGRDTDTARAAWQTAEGQYFVAGTASSNLDGNKTAPLIGEADFWLIRLDVETPGDCDGDGVPDTQDACPATPARGLVDARGCTIEQSCPCEMPWRNLSDYINCVRHVSGDFVRAGLLAPLQQEALIDQARQTNCPPVLPPADTVVSFGFTNIALGGARISSGSLEGSGSSFSYNAPVYASDLIHDGSRGMAVLLGEADSGMFFYPYAPVEWGSYDPENFMLGKAFGRLNGTDNLLLGAMQARKTDYEYYPVEIDLSPLKPSGLTLQVFQQGELQTELQVTGATTRVVVHSAVTLGPRANPFWRMPDGSVGAVIDFTEIYDPGPDGYGSYSIGLPTVEETVVGDRIFIRADNPANRVDFVSRFEVYAGGGLDSFGMIDGQIGMFKLPHRISGKSVFGAADGKLTIARLQRDEVQPDHGTVIELNASRLFDVSLEPVTLSSNEYFAVYLVIGAQEMSSVGPYVYYPAITASLAHRGSRVELSTYLDSVQAASVLVKVYKHGSLVGQAVAPPNSVGSFSAKSGGSGPRLIGFSASLGIGSNSSLGLTLSLDRLHTFIATTGAEFRGDLIRLEPQTDVRMLFLETSALQTTRPSFTIKDERAAILPPQLDIVASATNALLVWAAPNHPFALESAPSLDGPFTIVTNEPVIVDGVLSLPLPVGRDAARFFRLRLNEE